jgi:hypothetical protein
MAGGPYHVSRRAGIVHVRGRTARALRWHRLVPAFILDDVEFSRSVFLESWSTV